MLSIEVSSPSCVALAKRGVTMPAVAVNARQKPAAIQCRRRHERNHSPARGTVPRNPDNLYICKITVERGRFKKTLAAQF